MTSGQFIQKKLQAWAARKGISLQGSAGVRGEPNYTHSIEQNLFDQSPSAVSESLVRARRRRRTARQHSNDVRAAFVGGDGGQSLSVLGAERRLRGSCGSPRDPKPGHCLC